jgi:hypothetical protein
MEAMQAKSYVPVQLILRLLLLLLLPSPLWRLKYTAQRTGKGSRCMRHTLSSAEEATIMCSCCG